MSTATLAAPATFRAQVQTDAPARVPAPVLAPATAQLRLTRRGRLLIVIAALVGVVALVVGSAAGSAADGPASNVSTVVVQPGDTLWSLASQALPGIDPREAVDVIRELNSLESAVVVPGQALKVPTQG